MENNTIRAVPYFFTFMTYNKLPELFITTRIDRAITKLAIFYSLMTWKKCTVLLKHYSISLLG
jgi:hypothetical protein